MSANIYFWSAGTRKDSHPVFFQTRNRGTAKQCRTIYHRNMVHNVAAIPASFFKEHFQFDRLTGIYRTWLTWGDLRQLAHVETTREDI